MKYFTDPATQNFKGDPLSSAIWEKAVSTAKSFSKIAEMIENSDRLLYYTQKGNAEKVAKALDEAHTAIKQIKDKRYPAVLENYFDNLLLVGVNYDKTTKVHECVIEKYQK